MTKKRSKIIPAALIAMAGGMDALVGEPAEENAIEKERRLRVSSFYATRAIEKRKRKATLREIHGLRAQAGRAQAKARIAALDRAWRRDPYTLLPNWHGLDLFIRRKDNIAGYVTGVWPCKDKPGTFEERFLERTSEGTWRDAAPVSITLTDFREDDKYDTVVIPR